MKRLVAAAALILAVQLVASTFAVRVEAQAQPTQAQPMSEDVSITQRVENALAKDPFLRSMQIHVETQDGVVNLSGLVRSLEDATKAGELARTVRGVSAVRNGLRVADRPSRA